MDMDQPEPYPSHGRARGRGGRRGRGSRARGRGNGTGGGSGGRSIAVWKQPVQPAETVAEGDVKDGIDGESRWKVVNSVSTGKPRWCRVWPPPFTSKGERPPVDNNSYNNNNNNNSMAKAILDGIYAENTDDGKTQTFEPIVLGQRGLGQRGRTRGRGRGRGRGRARGQRLPDFQPTPTATSAGRGASAAQPLQNDITFDYTNTYTPQHHQQQVLRSKPARSQQIRSENAMEVEEDRVDGVTSQKRQSNQTKSNSNFQWSQYQPSPPVAATRSHGWVTATTTTTTITPTTATATTAPNTNASSAMYD